MSHDDTPVEDEEPFREDANLEDLEGYFANLDDPDLVLIDDVWYVRGDEAIEGLTLDRLPPEEETAGARARVAEYQARRERARRRRDT